MVSMGPGGGWRQRRQPINKTLLYFQSVVASEEAYLGLGRTNKDVALSVGTAGVIASYVHAVCVSMYIWPFSVNRESQRESSLPA